MNAKSIKWSIHICTLMVSTCSIVFFSGSCDNQQNRQEVQEASRPKFSNYYFHRKTQFENLPNRADEIIFVGNSITDQCEWAELFSMPNIINRGIGGDVTEGVLNRLDEITESKPLKIFLKIGTNDIGRGIALDSIMTNYDQILSRIQTASPRTAVYVQSVLPVIEGPNQRRKNTVIQQLNQQIMAAAQRYEYTYIDLYTPFTDQSGQLKNNLSLDGLHLNGNGYLLWKEQIQHFVQ